MPPATFQLKSPENGDKVGTFGLFDWVDTTDPDNDPITYSFLIAEDEAFSTVVHRQDALAVSATVLDSSAGLRDLSDYFWKVEAVDQFGARSSSAVRRFETDSTSTSGGPISAQAFGARSNTFVQSLRYDAYAGNDNTLANSVTDVRRPPASTSSNVIASISLLQTQDVGPIDVVLCAPSDLAAQQGFSSSRGGCGVDEAQIALARTQVSPSILGDPVLFNLDQISVSNNSDSIMRDHFE